MSLPPSTPTITLTTPTPHVLTTPALSTPSVPDIPDVYDTSSKNIPAEPYPYPPYTGPPPFLPRRHPAYDPSLPVPGDIGEMNDYARSPEGVSLGGVDMELVHDFGEGVGVDMRDFAAHAKDEMADHHLSTPQLQQGLSSQPPTSLVTNGMGDEPSTVNVDDMFQTETGLDGDDDDDDDDDIAPKKRVKSSDVPGGFTYVDKDGETGRRKIRIEYITDKSRRHITFSKRKAGIMKKAYELSILTGTQVLLLVVSETGLVYTFTTTKLQPLVQKAEGKNLIQACLNAPDGFGPDGQPLTGPVSATKAKNGGLAIRPHKLTAAASAAMAASAQAAAMSHPDSAGVANTNHTGGVGGDPPIDPAALGQGTPGSSRPKKRLPSGKRKAAGAAAASADLQHAQSHDVIPPVPPLPDIHRQPSPHSLNMALQSPISSTYPYPPSADYHAHGGGPSPTVQSFGYPQGGEYSYYPPPPPHHPHQHPHHPHHPQQHQPQHSQHHQQQQQQQQQYLGIGGLSSPYGHTGGPGHSPGGGPRHEGDRRMLGMGM